MDTLTRASERPAPGPGPGTSVGSRRLLVASAGPALIVVAVLIALRGFAFQNLLTSQHPDVLSFWLPRSCLLGRALADGRLPLWNPFEMAGTPFLADTQSGWLSLPTMLLSWSFGCGGGIRAIMVLNPILAGLGLWWFLRKEGLGRLAATAGGLSLSMAMAASSVAISLPFAGALAWTPFALVGASGYFSVRGTRRLGWLALSAIAWGQVAAAHLSHGLVMCTGLLVAYSIARSVHEVRAGALRARSAVLLSIAFLGFLPLANLAILIPRFALIQRSSLRAGYGGLQGTVARIEAIDRPIPVKGIWSGWPFALASTPGAYVGATMLMALAFAIRDRARRHVTFAFAVAGAIGYLLTITLLVGQGWFRAFVLWLPFGDVYLHNPGRLRYLALLVVPVLGAFGIQSLLDRRPAGRAWRWVALGPAVFLALPLAAGARAERLMVFAAGCAATIWVLWRLARRWRWAPVALVTVLATELLLGALWSSAYRGGTVFFGLESGERAVLTPGPLRWPEVPLDRYLEPGELARTIGAQGDGGGRYLAWIPPAAYFNKGYLFTQSREDWPALLLGRSILFELRDALGYSPIQLSRYWSYIRATNRLPVFYNSSVIQLPTLEDVRLLGVRYLVAHEGQPLPPGITGTVVAAERGYLLYEVDGHQPRVSVVPAWTVVPDAGAALDAILPPGFDPALHTVIEEDPGIGMTTGDPGPASATYEEPRPEQVRIVAEATAPSLVLIRNAWDRGWTATVDGSEAAVLRADHFLQAVAIPAGRHEIELTYREPAIGRGLAASAVAWAGFGLVLAGSLARSRRRAAPRRTRPRPVPPRGA